MCHPEKGRHAVSVKVADIPLPDFSLAGRSALVTAASRGIGAAIAVAMAHAGADVAINYYGPDDEAEAVAARARQAGHKVWLLPSDLSQSGAAPALIEAAVAASGKNLDILVSAGAIQIEKSWDQYTEADVDAHWALNGRAAFALMQAALPSMIERGHGRIITIGSVQEVAPEPEMTIYAGLKSAQSNMVKNLAKQVAGHGVTINNLAPGAVATPRNQATLDDPVAREHLRERIPVGFIGQSHDISGAAVFLASDAARYVTGIDLLVDGGWAL